MPCCFRSSVTADKVCQFPNDERELFEFRGQQFCRFHLPLSEGGGVPGSKASWSETLAQEFISEVHDLLSAAYHNGSRADLTGVVFPKHFSFSGYNEPHKGLFIILDEARFAEGANFDEANIWTLLARGCIFSTKVTFKDTKLSGEVNFSGAQFPGGAVFKDAKFREGGNFDNATFDQLIDFRNAVFTDAVSFESTTFAKGADFSSAVFGGESNFRHTKFNSKTYFHEAQFRGAATFHKASFSIAIEFIEARFREASSFKEAGFPDHAVFAQTRFRNDSVNWAILLKESGDLIVNVSSIKLGRKGYTQFLWIGLASQYFANDSMMEVELYDYKYEPGYQYADYSVGDQLAGFGIASLVAVAAGAKSKVGKGIVATILAFLAKNIWLPILVGIGGAWAAFKRITRPKPKQVAKRSGEPDKFDGDT